MTQPRKTTAPISDELQLSHAPKPNRYRKRLGLTVIAAVLVAGFTYSLREEPFVRKSLSRTADLVYSNFDFLSSIPPVNFGNNSSVTWKTLIEQAQVPARISNHYDIVVESHPTEIYLPRASDFGHEWLGHERVHQFREALPFDVRSSDSIFELSQKVRSLVDHGKDSLPQSDTDPIQYLEFAKENRRLTCRYFSIIYGATATVAGYTTRLLCLSKNGNKRDHAVCEVYVPEFSKWILIDSDFNVAYRRDGIWLNAAELHKVWNDVRTQVVNSTHAKQNVNERQEEVRRKTGVELVELGTAASKLRESNMYEGSPTGMNLEFFEYVLYCIRNDYLSAQYPSGHPVRNREYFLHRRSVAETPRVCPESFPIENIGKFYWPVGRSRIEIVNWSEEPDLSVDLRFSTWTPNFEYFEFRTDDGEWKRLEADNLSRDLEFGINVFEIRSVNTAALRGEIFRLQISVAQRKKSK